MNNDQLVKSVVLKIRSDIVRYQHKLAAKVEEVEKNLAAGMYEKPEEVALACAATKREIVKVMKLVGADKLRFECSKCGALSDVATVQCGECRSEMR